MADVWLETWLVYELLLRTALCVLSTGLHWLCCSAEAKPRKWVAVAMLEPHIKLVHQSTTSEQDAVLNQASKTAAALTPGDSISDGCLERYHPYFCLVVAMHCTLNEYTMLNGIHCSCSKLLLCKTAAAPAVC